MPSPAARYIQSSWLHRAPVKSDAVLPNWCTQKCKIFVLLKTIKLIKSAPTCFGSLRNRHQGAMTSSLLKLHTLFNCACGYRRCQCYGGILWPAVRVCVRVCVWFTVQRGTCVCVCVCGSFVQRGTCVCVCGSLCKEVCVCVCVCGSFVQRGTSLHSEPHTHTHTHIHRRQVTICRHNTDNVCTDTHS